MSDGIRERAKEAFVKHQITERGDRWWVCHAVYPGDGLRRLEYWFEVFAGRGELFVGGDIDCVVFGGCSESDPVKMVEWIGRSDVGYYGRQKAVIGMTSDVLVDDVDPDLVAETLRDWIATDCVAEDEVAVVQQGIAEIEDGLHIQLVLRALHEDAPNTMIDAERLGAVPSSRLVYAHAAVVRLHELLTRESRG